MSFFTLTLNQFSASRLARRVSGQKLVSQPCVAPVGPQVTSKISVPFHEVDAHNIVPVWEASPKRETGARTIRTKIHKLLGEYLIVSGFPSK